MGGGGAAIVAGLGDDAGADGAEVDVSEGGEKVRVIGFARDGRGD